MRNDYIHSDKDVFDKIIDLNNIRDAYFDLVRKFDEDAKSRRYRGIDGVNVQSIDFSSETIFLDIQREMIDMKDISPAYMNTIPKKNGKKRKIYVYSIRDRIKAEAIYRVLEPIFDRYLSDFLFSYRSSHPSYYAARSAVRRYKRYYGQNYILVTDISDYADSIDHDLLMQKIEVFGFSENTNRLLNLFIKTKTNENGVLLDRPRGVLTGTPLYALLSNLFMDDFDKWAGKYVAFYRRVGDDIIAMDKDENKIKSVYERLNDTVRELKLNINTKKANLIKDTEPFNFLGYRFSNGKVGFDLSSISKNKAKLKSRLINRNTKNKSIDYKIKRLDRLNRRYIKSFNYETTMMLEQKNLVDDVKQIKKFSDSIVGTVSLYLFSKDSHHNRKLARKVLKDRKIDTLLGRYVYNKSRYGNKYL